MPARTGQPARRDRELVRKGSKPARTGQPARRERKPERKGSMPARTAKRLRHRGQTPARRGCLDLVQWKPVRRDCPCADPRRGQRGRRGCRRRRDCARSAPSAWDAPRPELVPGLLRQWQRRTSTDCWPSALTLAVGFA